MPSVAYAAAPLVVWTVYWLAFFPGLVSMDSVNQWGQIVTGKYDDWHPVAHTWLVWLLTRPGHSLGTVSFLQVVLTALLVGTICHEVRRLGAPAWLVWGMVAWWTLSPVYAVGTIAVWKDAPFGLAVLWTVLILLRSAAADRLGVADGMRLGLACGLMTLFRHNGQLVAIPTFAVTAWYFWPDGRRAAAWAVVGGGLLVTAVIGATRAADVPHAPVVLKQQTIIHHVAGLIAAGTPLSDADRAVVEGLAPLDRWTAEYHCQGIGAFLYTPSLRRPLQRERWQLLPVWLHLAARNPAAVLRHWACVTRYVWWPSTDLSVGPLTTSDGTEMVAENPYGLVTASWCPACRRVLSSVFTATLAPGSVARALVWQPAVALYVLLVALVACRRGRWAALLVLSPALFNTVLWLAMSTEPHLRFQWPVVLVAPLALAFPTIGPAIVRRRAAR